MRTETRTELTDRLIRQDATRRDATGAHRIVKAQAIDALLGTVEHVTMWTEPNGRARAESRFEVPS